ncbi:MAG: ACP S-malonyltransferase [Candidatus Saccharibacteria bacterium]|nr:ACP S-malonyltransferase [Moraxellaceae bacterium]
MNTFNSAAATARQTRTALVFPGQGSQKAGMLAELAENYPQIIQTFTEASDSVGFDLWQIAQSGETLDQTEFTQPVLLTSSIALWRLWLDLGGVVPVALAGHSLGEYSALVAGGALSLTDGVRLVHLRGQIMQQSVPQGAGAMVAVLGLSDTQVEALCLKVSTETGDIVDPANYNAPGQVVIAGQASAVQAVAALAKKIGGKAISIPVSVPSHCRLMLPAAEVLAEVLSQTAIQMPSIPVIQNTRAIIEADLEHVKASLTQQLYNPVRWTQSEQTLLSLGVQQFVECGPNNVLTNLAKRMAPPIVSYPIDTRSRLEDALTHISVAEGKLA